MFARQNTLVLPSLHLAAPLKRGAWELHLDDCRAGRLTSRHYTCYSFTEKRSMLYHRLPEVHRVLLETPRWLFVVSPSANYISSYQVLYTYLFTRDTLCLTSKIHRLGYQRGSYINTTWEVSRYEWVIYVL